jgi:hypothetical protein
MACDDNSSGTVTVIDDHGNRSQQSSCFDFPILPDSLTKAGISWKYYGEGSGLLTVISHIYKAEAGCRTAKCAINGAV